MNILHIGGIKKIKYLVYTPIKTNPVYLSGSPAVQRSDYMITIYTQGCVTWKYIFAVVCLYSIFFEVKCSQMTF